MSREEQRGVSLPIDWHIPEGTKSRYANNVLVQVGQFEITISFFEAELPILLGQPEENKKKLEELGVVRAECVSKIVISPEFLPILIKALENGLETRHRSLEEVHHQNQEQE